MGVGLGKEGKERGQGLVLEAWMNKWKVIYQEGEDKER